MIKRERVVSQARSASADLSKVLVLNRVMSDHKYKRSTGVSS